MAGESLKQYLTFRAARQDLAVDVRRVRAISSPKDILKLEGLSEGLVGLVNLHGQTLLVVDLCFKLKLRPSGPRRHSSLVIIEVNKGEREGLIGFLADRVSDVISYHTRDVRGGTTDGVYLQDGFLYGKGRRRRVLDFDALISDEDLSCLASGKISPSCGQEVF